MRTGLFCLGLFGGFSLHNSQFINNTFFNSSSSPFLQLNSINTSNDHQLAFSAGIQPRAAQEIEHFRDVGWFKGRRRPFSAKFRNYILGDIIPLTHDVALFRFLLPEEDDEFHLKPCSTLQARVTYSGGGQDTIQRFYTPVTQNGTKGYFDIIVKRKPEGRMTAHMFGMRVGDVMQFRNVMFKLTYRANRWDHVGMIAGGTGFTPMLQVINHALKPVEDPYEIKEREERELQDRARMELEVAANKQELNEEVQRKYGLDKTRGMKTEQVDGEIIDNTEVTSKNNNSLNDDADNSSVFEPVSDVSASGVLNLDQSAKPSTDGVDREIITVDVTTRVEEKEVRKQVEEWDRVPIAPPELQPSKYNPIPLPPEGGSFARNDNRDADGNKRENVEAKAAIMKRTSDSVLRANARALRKEPEVDRTKLSFLFCNRTENHILLKTLFEKLAMEYPDRFKVKFCVDQPINPATWDGYVGYVTKQMIRETMPPPTQKRSIALLCGPDHLLHHVAGTSYVLTELSKGKPLQPVAPNLANLTFVGGLLGEMGYTEENVYKF